MQSSTEIYKHFFQHWPWRR